MVSRGAIKTSPSVPEDFHEDVGHLHLFAAGRIPSPTSDPNPFVDAISAEIHELRIVVNSTRNKYLADCRWEWPINSSGLFFNTTPESE